MRIVIMWFVLTMERRCSSYVTAWEVITVVKLPVKRFVIVFLSTGKKTCMSLIPLKRHIRLQ